MQNSLVLKVVGETYGLTITNTVTALPTVPSNALQARIQVELGAIRARYDGTATVTGGVGGGELLPITAAPGFEYVIVGWDRLNKMRMYRDGATDSRINVIFEGE